MANERSAPGGAAARLAPVLAAACLLLLLLWNLGGAPLLEPDEGRYAEIPREMVASGDLVTPHLNGVIYFEKPPLHYWLTAASISFILNSSLTARFSSSLRFCSSSSKSVVVVPSSTEPILWIFPV